MFGRKGVAFVNSEIVAGRARGASPAAWPTGEQSPGPCQAVLTPKNSQRAATFRAIDRPPICETWIRIKSISRSAIRGRYSCCVLNSSPIASGMLDCCRMSRKWSFSSGEQRVLQEEKPIFLQLLAEVDRLVRRDALVDVVEQLHVLAEVVRRCSKSFGKPARYGRAPRSILVRAGPSGGRTGGGSVRAVPPGPP